MEISRHFLLLYVIWCFLDKVHSVSFRIHEESLPCKSSERCIGIRQCPSFRYLLRQHGRNSLAAATIRDKHCGTKYKSSKVCCPSITPSVAPPSPAGNFSECGKSKKINQLFKRIAGGKNATIGSWPWMVALFYRSEESELKFQARCGASLISRQWLITAAHCTEVDKKDLFARLGDLDLDDRVKDGASPINALIDEIVTHPQYEQYPRTNDIALLRLRKPVSFTENIRPICLLSGEEYLANEYYNQKRSFISGWGSLSKSGNTPSHLQDALVTVTAQEKCAPQYIELGTAVIDEKVICARGPGKDTCEGDSGGPLMFLNNTQARFYLGGITSGGEGCAEENYPGVYAKVAQYIPWINKVTGGSF